MLLYLLSLLDDQNDTALFTSIYEQYERKIFAIALRFLSNIPDAEDAALATWERVAANFSTAKKYLSASKRAFESWICVIVKNQAKDELRRRKKAPKQLEVWDIPAPANTETEVELRMLKDAIRAMPDESRRLIEMRHFEGRSFDEIGRVLGCGKDTAKRRYERVVKALREQMKVEQE